jgi:hypothetical protein
LFWAGCIPTEKATQVLELRDAAREQALRIRLDATLNDTQREATPATIQTIRNQFSAASLSFASGPVQRL